MDVLEGPGKAVLYSSSFDETVLIAMNQLEDDLLKAIGQKLSDYFETTI